jgi:hypothetical protein
LTEFQLYQRFRLKMVQTFGSLGSALYEFGADPKTGRLSREDFEEVCTNRLGIFTLVEAKLVFSHVTNAVVLDVGEGGFCSPHDFGISDAEWKVLVEQKSVPAMPFTSTPSGTSMCVYHRAIHVQEAGPSSPSNASASGEAKDTAGGGHGKGHQQKGHMTSRASRTKALRQPQKPWTQSIYAGPQEETKSFTTFIRRSKPGVKGAETAFRTVDRGAALIERPRHSQLGDAPRTGLDSGYVAPTCPTARREMEPKFCAKQVDTWWPYEGKPLPRRLKLTPLVSARGGHSARGASTGASAGSTDRALTARCG